MASPATFDFGLVGMMSGGWCPKYPSHREDGSGSADGGRYAKIDYCMDNDSPLHNDGQPSNTVAHVRTTKARKMFRVTERTRRGGSGLYHPHEG